MTDTPALMGRFVCLEPLRESDAAALLGSITSDEVWAWKPAPQPRTVDEMRTLIHDVLIGPDADRQPFLIRRNSDARVIGSSSLCNMDPRHLCAEIGWTWLARDCWGQGYNEDMKYALLEHCYGHLGLHRIQWSADGSNRRSQRQLERIGLHREGVLRSSRVRVDGTRADTIVYSLLIEEWPHAAARLQTLINERMPTPSSL
jgi:RimJ/RimL family protein N-acetyltransferase